MAENTVSGVATNIITGFLGVGKTTLIQSLLKQKPDNERWAVLVNEFGEIGIDGALQSGKKQPEVFIREVPGGCMCCTSGLPMQIALNQLLARANPDRLLIEPTGLGHPKEVLASLAAEHYRDVLTLNATLTLVDARKIANSRYTDHPTFREQLQIADKIIATKTDLYGEQEIQQLKEFAVSLGAGKTPVFNAEPYQMDKTWLQGISGYSVPEHEHHGHGHHGTSPVLNIPAQLQQQGMVKVSNKGAGYYSCGWAFAANQEFDLKEIESTINGLDVERLKAVFITKQGIYGFNYADAVMTRLELDESDDSRLEYICTSQEQAEQIAEQLESSIFAGIEQTN